MRVAGRNLAAWEAQGGQDGWPAMLLTTCTWLEPGGI